MSRRSHSYVAGCLALLALACSDERQPTSPSQNTVGILARQTAIRKPVHWSAHVLPCADGERRSQLQSVYPLDERGDLILVGRLGSCTGEEDYLVFDLSSGEPVLLDAIDTGEPGFNLAAHSPRGSTIGFGAEGKMLVVYDGSFERVLILVEI